MIPEGRPREDMRGHQRNEVGREDANPLFRASFGWRLHLPPMFEIETSSQFADASSLPISGWNLNQT